MLIDLKSKSLDAYLVDLESKNAKHNPWNATKCFKRPVKRVATVTTSAGIWCRYSQEKANAFAEHLRCSFQPFDLSDPEDLSDMKRVKVIMNIRQTIKRGAFFNSVVVAVLCCVCVGVPKRFLANR